MQAFEDRYETDTYQENLVDVFTMAYVGGAGSESEVAADFIKAVEEYNERHGTTLIAAVYVDERTSNA